MGKALLDGSKQASSTRDRSLGAIRKATESAHMPREQFTRDSGRMTNFTVKELTHGLMVDHPVVIGYKIKDTGTKYSLMH